MAQSKKYFEIAQSNHFFPRGLLVVLYFHGIAGILLPNLAKFNMTWPKFKKTSPNLKKIKILHRHLVCLIYIGGLLAIV